MHTFVSPYNQLEPKDHLMRRSLYILLVIPVLTLANTNCTPKANKKVVPTVESHPQGNKPILLNVNSFEAGYTSNPNAQLVDVRTPGEFDNGHIKGAININYQGNNFTQEIEKLDKNKPTYVYCQSGGRSAEACNYMANHEFKTLYELDNGFSAWKHYKKPIEIPNE